MESIVAVLVSTIMSLLAVAGFSNWAKMGIQNVQTAATASAMVIFDNVATQYVKDNSAVLMSTATATVPVTVTAAMLSTAGYLPAGFSATNSFGQTWQLQVLQPVAGQLQALVTSQGANTISSPKQLVQIAAQAGAQGGFIPYANQAGDATMQPTNANGAYGAWKVSMANFTNPGSGHLASLLAFNGSQSNNGYLYRVPVAGQPQLNAMQTDLSMTDVGGTAHNITGAANVTAAGTVDAAGINVQNSDGTPYVGLGNSYVANSNAAQQLWLQANGGVNITNAAGTASAQLAVGNVISNGTVTASTVNFNTAAGSCTWNTVTMRLNNQMWVCNEYGNWVPISQLIGNVMTVQKFLGYEDGWGVAKPPCTAGTPTATIIPQTNGVNVVANPPWETNAFRLIDEGTWWYVQILAIDASGNGYSGNNLGLTAEVDTQCTFGNT